MATLQEGIQAGSFHPGPRSGRASTPGMTRAAPPTARDFMTQRVTRLRVDQSIAEAIETFITGGISGAPVEDNEGNIVGILSELDCMRLVTSNVYHQAEPAGIRKVGDFMSRNLYTVPPSADVFSIAQTFMERRIRRVLVMDGAALLGLVSRRDMLRVLKDWYC